MPNAMDTSPPTMNSARVPATSPLRKAANSSTTPPVNDQIATIRTSTSAVTPGHTSAVTPAARSISPTSRWPKTGPAVALLNARMACSPRADERVDREQDDQRENRHSRPGERDGPGYDREDTEQDQRGGCRLEHDRHSFRPGRLTPCRNHPPGMSLFASVGSLAETPSLASDPVGFQNSATSPDLRF